MNNLDFLLSYSYNSKLTAYQKELNKNYSTLQEIVYKFSNKYIIEDKFMLESPADLHSKRFHNSNEKTPVYAYFLLKKKKHWWSSPVDYGTIKMFDWGVIEIVSYHNHFNKSARIISSAYRQKEVKDTFVFPYI